MISNMDMKFTESFSNLNMRYDQVVSRISDLDAKISSRIQNLEIKLSADIIAVKEMHSNLTMIYADIMRFILLSSSMNEGHD